MECRQRRRRRRRSWEGTASERKRASSSVREREGGRERDRRLKGSTEKAGIGAGNKEAGERARADGGAQTWECGMGWDGNVVCVRSFCPFPREKPFLGGGQQRIERKEGEARESAAPRTDGAGGGLHAKRVISFPPPFLPSWKIY